MSIFSREKKTDEKVEGGSEVVDKACQITHPFRSLNSYTPLSSMSDEVYRSIREGVPIVDAAIYKIIRLLGGFEIKCENEFVEKNINSFFETVNVGGNQQGIQAFIDNFMSQLLTYGTAIGEMICDENGFYGLCNAPLSSVEVKRAKNEFDLVFYSHTLSGIKPLEHQEKILFSVLNPVAGEIKGTSLLNGLPFVSDILLKIYNTIGTNWQRVGNLRYAVTYKPSGDSTDKAYAKQRATQMAEAWRDAMSSKDSVKDFVAVGDVKVSVIGADNQVLDSEVPVRQMLEQIIAKTGLMPYMFGLNWSTTERMSQQQADILTTELEAYRRILNPIIKKIAGAYLKTIGVYDEVSINWSEITLQDETQKAQARLYNAQADNALKEVQD